VYFGIPVLLRYINYYQGTNLNINGIPGIVFAMIALGVHQSAFNSETIRSALQSVDKGQIEAAKSLGMGSLQVLTRIIIPEAACVALLPMGNSIISLIQGTSLAFTCSVVEMTAQSKILGAKSYRYFEAYCGLALIYLALTIILEQLIKLAEKKMSIPDQAAETDGNGNKVGGKKR
jgi:polar amino acid transport system permease protein